jgi:hypothetical protein
LYFLLINNTISQTLVAHACNPSYSEGRDQEDLSLKPAQANRSQDPLENPSQKRAGGVAQGVDPEFKPQYHKKKCIISSCLGHMGYLLLAGGQQMVLTLPLWWVVLSSGSMGGIHFVS